MTKDEVISKQSEQLLKQTELIRELNSKLAFWNTEAEKKEELRKKWYEQLQQAENSLKVEKDQNTFLQRKVTDLEHKLGVKQDGKYHLKQAIKKWLKL
jgi:hypothetical protein